ncbi:MAG TPA: methylthioribulose 1-phosphate dehydratase [Actinomycetota bacterium]
MDDLDTRELLCELLRSFYDKGWVSGTGGGICGPAAAGGLLLAPTGVHKERVKPQDFFVIDAADGTVRAAAEDPALRPSECAGVFTACTRGRGARSVAHSHALGAVLAADAAGGGDHLAIAGFEMLKGIRGLSNRDEHLVPVIRNTPRESELVDQVEQALADPRFAGAFCILVADHGAYVWGEDVWEAKRHAEVYHWLFDGVLARATRGRNQ